MFMTSVSEIAYEAVKSVYKHHRYIVDAMVKAGQITSEAAQSEWAKRVAKELIKHGHKVPKTILSLLK